ncbi:hypothetical protein EVAR_44561_1 [Eumeta japonica]|uniref:Uncharacterized protein n=1 Tax=Eumeta variegata TaxID=151549 RepID=A0A4C1XCK7_EUMVA|nr:hypothetical protein EVAR_44561_1 [Eumeta japonica]
MNADCTHEKFLTKSREPSSRFTLGFDLGNPEQENGEHGAERTGLPLGRLKLFLPVPTDRGRRLHLHDLTGSARDTEPLLAPAVRIRYAVAAHRTKAVD